MATELVQRYLNTWLSPECQTAWLKEALISPAVDSVPLTDELKANPATLGPSTIGTRLFRLDATNFTAIQAQIQRNLKG